MQAVVVVIDDLQWAEPVLLDLLRYLSETTTDRAIMLLGVARPELLDTHPEFALPQALVLQPLGNDHTRALITSVLDDRDRVAEEVFERVSRAARVSRCS